MKTAEKIDRRTVLRGMLGGTAVSVGLPLLDCFLNESGTALAATGAPLPLRFGTWFWGLGFNPGAAIAPKYPEIEFLRECKPLEPHKKHINYFSAFNTPLDGRGAMVHFTGWVGARTGMVPFRRVEIPNPTIDVLVADHLGSGTRFRSLDLSCTGDPADSYTFRDSGSINAAEVSPIAFYQRVFGEGFSDPNSSEFKPDPRFMLRRSVLSAVGEQSKDFLKVIGSGDRSRMDEYFTSIRQLERQLELQLQKPPPAEACAIPPRPAEGPIGLEIETVITNHKLLTQTLAFALACRQTKIFNMLLSRSLSVVRKPGETNTHHGLTHEEPVDKQVGYQVEVSWFNIRQMEALAYFIHTLENIREGDGTLLDRMVIFANTDTNDARVHALDGVPAMTVGNAGGRLKTGMHINGNGDPISRIGYTLMQAVGVPIDGWGTGSLQTSKAISEILA